MTRTSLTCLPCLLAALLLGAASPAGASEAAAPETSAEPRADAKAKAEPKPAADAKPGETFDDQARFIAGLPVSEGSPLAEIEKDEQWQDYAKALADDWAKLQDKRLEAMIEFSAKELAPKIDPKANLFYFFGGPDLVSALVLYPEAPVYVLAGLEPIGEIPQISAMRQEVLDRAIDNLRKTIRSTVRSNFFRTNEMAGDLTRTEFKGVLPVLMLFAARTDYQVLDVQLFELDDQGAERALSPAARKGDRSKPLGVRMEIQKKGRDKPQTVYYLRQNVENSVLERTPGFLAFFQKRAPANHFFKAASFILHNTKRFSKCREFVLDSALSILQDDSGVPFEQLKPKKKGKEVVEPWWDLHLYGKYLRPLPPFDKHYQDDLIKAFKEGPVAPLPFVTGYRHEGEANLVLAIAKKAETAEP